VARRMRQLACYKVEKKPHSSPRITFMVENKQKSLKDEWFMAPNYLVEEEGEESTVAIGMRILDG
jgi:hypothetical protein